MTTVIRYDPRAVLMLDLRRLVQNVVNMYECI